MLKPDGSRWEPRSRTRSHTRRTTSLRTRDVKGSLQWTPAAVYRFFDSSGDLLYVGLTNDTDRRFEQHAALKPWWPEVDRIEVDWFNVRFEAEANESVAIWQERPRYNILSPIAIRNHPHPGPRIGEFTHVYDAMGAFFEHLVEEWS